MFQLLVLLFIIKLYARSNMFYLYFTLNFKFFHSLCIFTKKQKMKYITCFSFFIFKRKMKNKIQLTPMILFFNKD